MMMHTTRNSKCSNNNNVIIAITFVAILLHCVQALPNKDVQPSVKINKCCEKFEILVDMSCTSAASINACEFIYFNSHLEFVRDENFKLFFTKRVKMQHAHKA
jgi:hypothetical protein